MPWTDPHRNSSASASLNYPELTTNVGNLANMIRNELQMRGDGGTTWTVTPNVGGNGDIYLNISAGGFPFAHISFHMGPSATPNGSTHIQYTNGPTRRILVERGIFIAENLTPPYNDVFEEIIIRLLNQFAQYYAQILRNKYLKYKNKYLQLKYELGI